MRLVRALALLVVGAAVASCSGPSSGARAPGPAASGSVTSSPGAVGPAAALGAAGGVDVAAENRLAGTTAATPVHARGVAPGLQAFADRVSVRPGESVGLYVDARGPVTVQALRTGWYGGAGAREVWHGAATASPQPKGVVDDAPIPDAGGLRGTRTAVAPWRLTTTVDTTGWPEGAYLLRLDTARATRFVPLRSAARARAGACSWCRAR